MHSRENDKTVYQIDKPGVYKTRAGYKATVIFLTDGDKCCGGWIEVPNINSKLKPNIWALVWYTQTGYMAYNGPEDQWCDIVDVWSEETNDDGYN